MKAREALTVLFRNHGSTLIRTALISGLPGFVTREADGELQTTALEIDDGMVTAIYVMRNPDKLMHLHEAAGMWPQLTDVFCKTGKPLAQRY
jgi:RNA polymerase sigma-70 factor (ECF subfamily)